MDPSFFSSIKTIAIVGLSDKPDRASYQVASYLKEHGFTIIPVNPSIQSWNGIVSYPSLSDIPKEIVVDVVDVFRRSEFVLPIVQSTIRRSDVKTIWLQEGVENETAEALAKQHGLRIVANMCMMKTHKKLSL